MGIFLRWPLVSVAHGKIPIFYRVESKARKAPQGSFSVQERDPARSCTAEEQGTAHLQKCKVLPHRTRKDKCDTAKDGHAGGECTPEDPVRCTVH